MTALVLAAHGSADPRSAANARSVADQIRRLRPGLGFHTAFCEQNSPRLDDVLSGLTGDAVVAPLLLAGAYHARVDIPVMMAESAARRRRPGGSGVHVRQADVLGEDERLVQVMRGRLAEAGVSRLDGGLGVIVVAVGSSNGAANARTARLAESLAERTRWAGVQIAFATGPAPSVAVAAERLRAGGADHAVIAPWFLAHGRITDRVGAYARGAGIPMAAPLGAHRLVAATVLDRFDQAVAARAAA